MEEWLKISLLLCTFGFFKEIRPSEPYVTHYLLGPWWNLTEEQVYEEIYPVGTYSTLAFLVVVFLVTDLLRYKPIIILDGILGIAVYTLLIWGQGVPISQLIQVLYGGFIATEVAYYTYIYAKVDRDKYLVVSGHTRAAYLTGRCVSGLTAQLLVSTDLMDYRELNFITLGAMIVATAWAFLLPSVKSSLYFHNTVNNNSEIHGQQEDRTSDVMQDHSKSTRYQKAQKAFLLMWRDLKSAYSDLTVIKWSIWWALGTCGFYQVLNYTQLLWEVIIQESGQQLLNGAVEFAYTIIGAACALGIGTLRFNWAILGTPTLTICAIVQSVALFFSANTSDLWTAYACYITCLVAYQALATIASAEIAKKLKEDSYALIFGVNMFMALALQSILTAIVNTWLQLPARQQFIVYASYFALLGAGFAVLSAFSLCTGGCSNISWKSLWLPKASPQPSHDSTHD